MWKVVVLSLCVFLALAGSLGAAGISYEGELSMSGAPADGWFDLRFQVFDRRDGAGAKALGAEVLIPGVRVTDGRFRVEIDSGDDPGDASELWLEIGVKRAGAFGDYTTLQPRQRLHLPGAPDRASKAATVPTGGVVFFDFTVCPDGWSEYLPARGRFLVALPAGGTVGATFGTPLTDLEDRKHTHTLSASATSPAAGSHNHAWSRLFINGAGDRVWTSHNAQGSEIMVTAWGNGIGNEGSGIYPLAAQPTQTFYTNLSGSHSHDITVTGSSGEASTWLPYAQLLACRKN